jgi:hypothetical protein
VYNVDIFKKKKYVVVYVENPRKHRDTTKRNQEEEIHTHLKTTRKENKGPTKSTLTTCELIHLQAI